MDRTEHKGGVMIIEDWQSETNIILINDPDDPPTFYSRG